MARVKFQPSPVMTPDVKDLLLEAIAIGLTTRRACQTLGVETQTFYLALGRDAEYRERYEAAKAACVDALVDDGEEAAEKALTADNGAQVAGIKVFSDYKKWMASRLAPQRWGEKASVHVTGQVIMDETEMAKRVAFLEMLNAKGPGSDAEPDDDEEPLV